MTPKPRRRKAVELPRAQHLRNKRYGRRWQAISDEVLRRAHYKCEIRYPGVCIGRADVADHIDEDGPSVIGNAQAACRPCNQAKGYLRRMEQSKSAGQWPAAWDLDGGCASRDGGPHDLREWGGPAKCWGQVGHASRDW
jgi:hypothetical protein